MDIYQAKCKPERKRFGNFMFKAEQKCDVFKIAKRIIKTNQDIIGENCVRSDASVLVVSDEDKKIAWKSYHKKLSNTELAWNRNSFSQTDISSEVLSLTDKGMVRESVSKMKNGKAAGPSL